MNANATNANPAAPTTPEDDLKAKLAALKVTQDNIAKLNEQANAIQTEVKTLQAKISEIDQTMSGYGASSIGFNKDLGEAKKTICQKTEIAEAVVKDVKDKIKNEIKTVDDQLAALKKSEGDALAASDAAAEALNTASDAVQKAQSAYDAAKKLPKDNEAKLKEVKSLLDQVSKAEAQSDYVAMYFLTSEADAAAKIEIPAEDEYRQQLRTAQAAVEDAKKAFDAAKESANKKSADYAEAAKAHQQGVTSRRSDILERLKTVKPNVGSCQAASSAAEVTSTH